jgi:eukaryotic-like serine/threonine-protein kinase
VENTFSTGAGLLLAGRYRLGEPIGRGGMGKVWRAHDEVLHRVVAVKELTAGLYASEADRAVLHARTQKEARAAARISHPGVVTVHDVLEHDARPWIVMQYVDGPSLADAAKEAGHVSALEGARVGLHVLGALGAAHAAGVLHRDVKPANVLLAKDGRVLITDFGIAAIDGYSTITRTGEIVGSVDYLAPERVRGGDPGPASDLWSLGATLYTAVEGESPFRRSSPLASMQAVVSEEPPYPGRSGPLGAAIAALLRKDPEARPSAAEAERMLESALTELRGSAPTVSVPSLGPTATIRVERPPDDSGDAAESPGTGAAPPQTPAPASTARADPDGEVPQAPATPTAPVVPTVPAGTVRRGGGRLRRAAIVVVLAAVIGGGAGLAVKEYAGRDSGGRDDTRTDARPGPSARTAAPGGSEGVGARPDTSGGPRSGSAEPSAGAEVPAGATAGSDGYAANGDAPEGWVRIRDQAGFSLLLPEGWQRQVQGGQIDYSPDGGRHRLRIGVDPSPDFEDAYAHALNLEKILRRELPDYRRLSLEANFFRDQDKSALWEFTWTERTGFPGKRRGIDQLYVADDGTEYALYMTGPEESWERTRGIFDTVLKSWRPKE